MGMNDKSLGEFQAAQARFDTVHWGHDRGFPTIRHSTLHLGKLLGKLSAYCEAVEHGEEPTGEILDDEVIPDLAIFAARLANDRGRQLGERIDTRTLDLEYRFSGRH